MFEAPPKSFLKTSMLLTAAACGIGLAGPAHASLVVEYQFDGIGTTAVNSGADSTPAQFTDGAGAVADLHGAAGSGVSGQPGDLAFDNTATDGMRGNGGVATADGGPLLTALDGAESITFSGWFKTAGPEAITPGARLITFGGTGGGFLLQGSGSNDGNLFFRLSGQDAQNFSQAGGDFSQTQEWVMLALTYDSTKSADNVKLYQGTADDSMSEVLSVTFAGGAYKASGTDLEIGNAGTENGFDGFIDDFRIYAEQSGSGGALSQSQLEDLRVQAVPEPGSMALVGLGSLAMFRRRRRQG